MFIVELTLPRGTCSILARQVAERGNLESCNNCQIRCVRGGSLTPACANAVEILFMIGLQLKSYKIKGRSPRAGSLNGEGKQVAVEGEAHQAVALLGGTVQHSRQAVALASGDQTGFPDLARIFVNYAAVD